MTRFYERPDDDRMQAIRELDAIGPCSFSYSGDGITITIPRGMTEEVLAWAARHALNARDWFYFPLGSDKVPDIMRHDASYKGSRGFHLYVHCVPVA